MGKALNGQADYVDILTVVAYSTIPAWIEVPITFYKVVVLQGDLSSSDYWIINGLHILSWVLTMKILIQGIQYFNGFGILKSVLLISPFWLFSLFLHLLPFFIL